MIEQHRKKRTWKENKLYKAELRKDRGTFSKGGDRGHHQRGGAGFSGSRNRRGQLSRDELKKISKCRLCQRRATGLRIVISTRIRTRTREHCPASAMLYTRADRRLGSGIRILLLHLAIAKGRLGMEGGSWTFLSLKASGIGGAAKVLKVMLVPIAPAGAPARGEHSSPSERGLPRVFENVHRPRRGLSHLSSTRSHNASDEAAFRPSHHTAHSMERRPISSSGGNPQEVSDQCG